jgi:hypothetical protein
MKHLAKYWFLFFALLVVICVAAAGIFIRHPEPASVAESLATGAAPWPAETAHLKERLAALGLPALAAEGTALHTHEHLDIMLRGAPTGVPAGIGIHESFPSFIASIHTHDTTGIIHVESPTVEQFTLGQFFDIWGVRLTDSCIGGYCADGENTLTAYVNGERFPGNPRDIELTEHEEIMLVYGTPSETPATIPQSYDFPADY